MSAEEKNTPYVLGCCGEAEAEAFLAKKGWKTLAKRYRGADGELDLVMADGEALVFVEVKQTSRGGMGAGLLRVTPSKQRRMQHAAEVFMMERGWTQRPARFDVVEVTASGILHVPCAFEADDWKSFNR